MKKPPYPIHTSTDDLQDFEVHRANSVRPLIPIAHQTLRALIAEHSTQPDFEAKLLQEALSFDYGRSELLDRYGELFANSPIPTSNVTAEEFLSHLYQPGESVFVMEDLMSIAAPCLWERLSSPGLSPTMGSFWPLIVNPEMVQQLQAGAAINAPINAALITTGYRYAAVSFRGDEVTTQFTDIIGGRWPVVAVVSAGEQETHILFRIAAATYRNWSTEAKRIIREFSAELPRYSSRLTDAFPLPSLHKRQRLVYLEPV